MREVVLAQEANAGIRRSSASLDTDRLKSRMRLILNPRLDVLSWLDKGSKPLVKRPLPGRAAKGPADATQGFET